MAKYFDKVQTIKSVLQYFDISLIPQSENVQGRTLSRLVTLENNSFKWTYIKYLETPSINNIEKVQQVTYEPSWIDPFIKYITEGVLPNNHEEARLLK